MGDRNPKAIHKQTSQKQARHDKEKREREEAIRNKQESSERKK